jgi:hypothetical protein
MVKVRRMKGYTILLARIKRLNTQRSPPGHVSRNKQSLCLPDFRRGGILPTVTILMGCRKFKGEDLCIGWFEGSGAVRPRHPIANIIKYMVPHIIDLVAPWCMARLRVRVLRKLFTLLWGEWIDFFRPGLKVAVGWVVAF